MRKLFVAFTALAICSVAALAGNYPSVPYMTTPPEAGTAPFNSTIANVNTYSTGLLHSNAAVRTATAAATTQTLDSYTLPANYLATTGQVIRIKGVFTFAANINNKTPIITFGTFTYTGTLNATSGGTEHLECLVTKTGSSTQMITCSGMTDVTPIVNSYTAGTSTDTADIAITAKCTQGSASADCSVASFIVESLR